MNVLTKQSFLPCRWSFWSVLSCQDSLSYPSASVQALWRLILKQNDEDLLLLVPSDLSNPLKIVLWYCCICCHSYRYNKNILTTETATRTPSVISCWVWELNLVFFLLYFQSPALESKRFKMQRPILIVLLKTKLVNDCTSIAIE